MLVASQKVESPFKITLLKIIGPDGMIYVGSGTGGPGISAIYPNGTRKWIFGTGGCVSSPAIGDDGTIYCGTHGGFYALNPNGTVKWFYDCGQVFSSPAIGSDGTIYFGGYTDPGGLYALNPSGILKWKYNLGPVYLSTPVISGEGTIYIGTFGKELFAINPSGTLKWQFMTNSAIYSSPAISSSGNVYIVSGGGIVYALGSGSSSPTINATATGPLGAGHSQQIDITYDWAGTPSAVDLFYSVNNGNNWTYIATDYSLDGHYEWWLDPNETENPKPIKYYWIANTRGGADDVGLPANGTSPEAGPYNWKTFDVTLGGSAKAPGDIGWYFVSVPLDVSGNITTIFNDSNWGDGGTTWDCMMWYDSTDHSDPWKTYNKYKPEILNDLSEYTNMMGVWIHITSNDNDGFLTAGEGVVASSTTITLSAGWNLVGYPTMTEKIMADALWGTGVDKVQVFDPAEPYRIKEVGATYIMKPGEGYWVHTPADTVWIVDW